MKIKLAVVALFVAPFAFAAAEPLKIAVIVKAKQSTYWDVVHAGADKAKADLAGQGDAVDVMWDGAAEEDQIEQQAKLVQSYIDKKVGAIVLAPSNAQALVPVVEKAKAANIPVIVIDSLLGSETPASTVATNNYKAGLLAGRRLAEAMGGKGNVALFRFLKGHGSSQPRESGFLDAVKKYPDIKVISSEMHSGPTTAEATKNAGVLLEKYGANLQGVFAPNLYATEGMLAALRTAGLAGKVKFVGFDSTDALVDALRKNDMSGLCVQQPFLMGYLGVKSAVSAARHRDVEKEVDTEVMVVTKENLDSKEVQKLLNPGKA
jgi:ribose transport system substrate-binding protein